MKKIKITSNPYEEKISYQKWKDSDNEWKDIDCTNSKNSKLLSSELSASFFPFSAIKILDAIIEEYGIDGDTFQIIFEGSDDEYQELEEVCKLEKFKDIIFIERSNKILENARDILPEIKQLFTEMNPLINQCVKNPETIKRNLERFSDASNDIVPICVFGNYSSGKSTFINALIGAEILPSGTEPITSKIYKVSRSKYPDRAYVKCQYKENNIDIVFTDKETKIENADSNALLDALCSGLEIMNDKSIVVRVNKALSIINSFEINDNDALISDLIEVEIPFNKGVLAQSQHPFVLFDTPGSNSASNARHREVLKEAMDNMTNGLPIFLSTSDALDSTDNENLYYIIRDMKELDSRFTMIVVNKADGPGLLCKDFDKYEESSILNQAIPRHLYSGGLFYVSSIIGLGSKNDGKFLDDYYAEIYEDQVYKYNNPNGHRYKTLYKYNIMPKQIEERSDSLAVSLQDLEYANSGLYSIETEIENFAGKYSSYNKCFQSQMFLNDILDKTSKEIQQEKEKRSAILESLKEKLEDDKEKLIEKLEMKACVEKTSYDRQYNEYMDKLFEEKRETYTSKELSEEFDRIEKQIMSELKFGEYKDSEKKAINDVVDDIKGVFKRESGFSFDRIKSKVGTAKEAHDKEIKMKRSINKASAENLLNAISEKYTKSLDINHDFLELKSQSFWIEKTEELKEIFIMIISGSESLSDEKREELKEIILKYQKLSFPETSAKEIFNKENFEKRLKIFDKVLWVGEDLQFNKLAKTFNTVYLKGILERFKSIEESHCICVLTWIQNLQNEICTNIVEYSPELTKDAKIIQDISEEIQEWEQRKVKLDIYANKLRSMMDWKAVL